MPRVPITSRPEVAERIRSAMQQGKLIIIAQRETTRIVRPERPDIVEFIAVEER